MEQLRYYGIYRRYLYIYLSVYTLASKHEIALPTQKQLLEYGRRTARFAEGMPATSHTLFIIRIRVMNDGTLTMLKILWYPFVQD